MLYMKYLTVYDIIKKRPDFKQHPVKMYLNQLTVITSFYMFVSPNPNPRLPLNLNGLMTVNSEYFFNFNAQRITI